MKISIKKYEEYFQEGIAKSIAELNEYSENLSIPWSPALFNSIENRRRLLGIGSYGWLGHIGASGDVRRMFSNGTLAEKRKICKSINTIAQLSFPIDYEKLRKELNNLVALGPTIKAWGRLLAITQPNIYCTMSAPTVRNSLSVLLGKPQSYFTTVNGYIDLLSLIHKSPWFNSPIPTNKKDLSIWQNRVAFLDFIFY